MIGTYGIDFKDIPETLEDDIDEGFHDLKIIYEIYWSFTAFDD